MQFVSRGALAALVCLAAADLSRAAEWSLEDGSQIRFVATQEGSPVEGGFESFDASIVFDPEDAAAARIAVDIDVTSVTSGHKDRDEALRSPSLFHVENWPAARFVSDELTHLGDDRYEARGKLTIRDVTADVVLPFELVVDDRPNGGDLRRARASGELTISRLAYGVGQGDFASTNTIGDEVVIRIDIVAAAPQ